jgi:acyl-CoA thioesterase
MKGSGDKYSVEIPDDWLQGRTAYGGITAALCLEAAQRLFPDMPPLRSSQFTFVGPAIGRLEISSVLLRRGKSTAFVQTNVTGESGPALRSILCFGAPRESQLQLEPAAMPKIEPWDNCPPFLKPGEGPRHLAHFESRIAGGSKIGEKGEPRFLVWLRHLDPHASGTGPGLLALADALPPPAFALMAERKAISTVTWSIDYFRDPPGEEICEWWLMESKAGSAMDGYSTQEMSLWDCKGRAVLSARQNVAIFT